MDLDWTGSEIYQLSGFWIGLDPEMCHVYPIFRDLRQFLLIVTLTSEVLPSYLRLNISSFVFTCRFYKVFGRYLLCCVRIGLGWIQLLGHQLHWTGLGSVARGFGLDWIVSTQSISYSATDTRASGLQCLGRSPAHHNLQSRPFITGYGGRF